MAMHLFKNNYVGRTFIKPKQEQRESSVKVKLNVLKEAVEGKRVIMIDNCKPFKERWCQGGSR